MTFVGKILTFLILIMSIVFMSFTLATYATHRNWRDMVQGTPSKPGLKTQLDNAKRLLQEAETEREELKLTLERERASRRETLASKETRIGIMTKELDEMNGKYAKIEAEHRKNIETVNMAQTQMEKAKNELDSLRGDFQRILGDRNSQLATATKLNDKLIAADGKFAMAERNIESLRNNLSEAVLKIDQGETGVGATKIAGQATLELDGRVTAIGQKDLVVVSLGSDEGLRTGDKLEVWRGNGSYIGRLIVVETKTDTAVARVVPEYLQGVIRQGDSVGTKLL